MKNQYFVFEKKELFILILLAVLIAGVAFTVGVKWGKEIPVENPLGAASDSFESESDTEAGQELPRMTESQKEEEQIQKAMSMAQGVSGEKSKASQGNDPQAEGDQAQSSANQGSPPPMMSSDEELNPASDLEGAVSEKKLDDLEDRLNASSNSDSDSEPYGGRGVGEIYTIQLGAHRSREEASKQKKFLASRGFSAQIVQVELPEKGTWYRVTVGTFGSREKAKAFSKEVKKKIPNTSFLLQKLN